MNERTIRDQAGKTWSVMVRRVNAEGAGSDDRAWALCFRLKGEHTQRTLTQILPDAEPPNVGAYSEDELCALLEPHVRERAEIEARAAAEAESAKAAARAANVAAQAAKAEALRARNNGQRVE